MMMIVMTADRDANTIPVGIYRKLITNLLSVQADGHYDYLSGLERKLGRDRNRRRR